MRFRFHQPSATRVVTEIKCEGGVREHSVGEGKFRIPLDGAGKEFGGGLEGLEDVAIAGAKAFQIIVIRLGIAAIAVTSRERHAKLALQRGGDTRADFVLYFEDVGLVEIIFLGEDHLSRFGVIELYGDTPLGPKLQDIALQDVLNSKVAGDRRGIAAALIVENG